MSRERLVLDQINIVSGDVPGSADFYQLLGFEIEPTLDDWVPHHQTVATGGAIDVDLDSAAFARVWNRGWPGGNGMVIGFRTSSRDDVDDLHAELVAAGHVSQQEPYDTFWGSRYALVADPGGNSVGLMSAPDPERRFRPAPPPST